MEDRYGRVMVGLFVGVAGSELVDVCTGSSWTSGCSETWMEEKWAFFYPANLRKHNERRTHVSGKKKYPNNLTPEQYKAILIDYMQGHSTRVRDEIPSYAG